MPPKRLKQLMSGEVVSADPVSTYKAKPKPYIEPQWLIDYKRDRDRVIWKLFPECRDEIKEKYGF